MAEDPVPPAPALVPKLPTTLPFEDEAAHGRRQGCLKWGLVGCAGASVLLIVGMLFVMSKGRPMMDSLLRNQMEEVAAAAAPEASPAEKEAFRRAIDPFVEKAKNGKISFDEMTRIQKQRTAILADGHVSAEELRDFTAALKSIAP